MNQTASTLRQYATFTPFYTTDSLDEMSPSAMEGPFFVGYGRVFAGLKGTVCYSPPHKLFHGNNLKVLVLWILLFMGEPVSMIP